MALRQEQDVVLCRNHARSLAAVMQCPAREQIRIATAVSEIARNAYCHGRDGTVEFSLENIAPSNNRGAAWEFICTIRDRGPGIPSLREKLEGEQQ